MMMEGGIPDKVAPNVNVDFNVDPLHSLPMGATYIKEVRDRYSLYNCHLEIGASSCLMRIYRMSIPHWVVNTSCVTIG